MSIPLFQGETQLKQLTLVNDVLILTDRRLLYENKQNGNNDTFIGLNQISKMQSRVTPFVFYKITNDQVANWSMMTAGIGLVIFVIYFLSKIYGSAESNYYGILFLTLIYVFSFGTVTFLVFFIILSIVKSLTKETRNQVQVGIYKTDGSNFFYGRYDVDVNQQLKEFEAVFNEQLFTKSNYS